MPISCRMIDAEMYGMIPSAKIDRFSSAPPENMLKNEIRLPLCLATNCRIALRSTPGVVTNTPTR